MSGQYLEMSSVWTASASFNSYPALAGDRHVDVVVVGGGIAGATTAYLLKQAGKRVALIERRRCGSGETGRSSAHLSTVPDASYHDLTQRLGLERATGVWEAAFAALTRVRSIVRDERVHCEFDWVRGWLYASAEDTRDTARLNLHREVAAAQAIGIDAQYVDSLPGVDAPAVVFENQARMHPLKYLAVLLDRVDGDGSFVCENTPVDALEERPWAVRCGAYRITADAVVLATHEPFVTGDVADNVLQAHVQRRRTYLVGGLAPRGAFEEGLYWEHRQGGYEHLRVDRRENYDEVLFGGQDHPSTADDQSVEARNRLMHLERALRDRMPGARITRRWSGHVFETTDGLPFIGEASPGRFVATGFGGNGLTFGTLAAMMATDAILGRRNAWVDLFGLGRPVRSTVTIAQPGVWPAAPRSLGTLLTFRSPHLVT